MAPTSETAHAPGSIQVVGSSSAADQAAVVGSTCAADQVPALRLFLEAERLLDAGYIKAGRERMREAFSLAPELDTDDWPAWAESLYERGLNDVPLLAATETGWIGESWLCEAALDWVSDQLLTSHFAILDGFLHACATDQVKHACSRLQNEGKMHPPPARKAGGRKQGGDLIAWVDHNDAAFAASWPALSTLVQQTDDLVRRLESHIGLRIDSRLRPMISRYGRGSAFSRHVDAHAGDGRVLSAIFYCNNDWQPLCGGCLRIHSCVKDANGNGCDLMEAVADVAPCHSRLLLFFADERCPHEVLPVTCDERFAVTMWFKGETLVQ